MNNDTAKIKIDGLKYHKHTGWAKHCFNETRQEWEFILRFLSRVRTDAKSLSDPDEVMKFLTYSGIEEKIKEALGHDT